VIVMGVAEAVLTSRKPGAMAIKANINRVIIVIAGNRILFIPNFLRGTIA